MLEILMIEVMNVSLPANSSTLLNSLMLLNRDQPLSSRRSRRRGLVLTQQGWQKLMQAGVLCDRYSNRYTFEVLAGRSALSPRTVSKILNRSSPVDKRTLTIFFDAFQLSLESDDYALHDTALTEQATNFIEQHQTPNRYATEFQLYATEFQLLVEEVMQLKEQLEDYSQRFKLLDLTESTQKA
jgi:transcriptional regulator with XRE-family HTH domain